MGILEIVRGNIIPIVIAVVVGVPTLLYARKKYLQDRASIEITFKPAFEPLGEAPRVVIKNTGRVPVHFSGNLIFKLPYGSKDKYLYHAQFGNKLEVGEGRGRDIYPTLLALLEKNNITPKQYVAFIKDTTGKKHWSHSRFVRWWKICS